MQAKDSPVKEQHRDFRRSEADVEEIQASVEQFELEDKILGRNIGQMLSKAFINPVKIYADLCQRYDLVQNGKQSAPPMVVRAYMGKLP